MPRVNIPVTAIVEAGIVAPTAVTGDAANDHSFVNDGRTFLEAKNTSAGSLDVTIITSQQVSGLDLADRVVTIAAGVVKVIGPFNASVYAQSSDLNKVWVDITSASWELRAYSLP